MFTDLSNQIKAQLYDRAKSPLFGAFILSWSAWNFRTIIIFFSDAGLDTKLFNLDLLYPTTCDYLLHGLAYPFLTASAFISVYPYPAKWAFYHWQKQHSLIKKIQQKIEDETPATQAEINATRKAAIEQQIAFQSQIQSLSDTNREFSKRENTLVSEIETIRRELLNIQSQKEELENLNTQLKNTISNFESKTGKDQTNMQFSSAQEISPDDSVLLKLINNLESSDSAKSLIEKFKRYCSNLEINDDMALILMALVMKDGHDNISSIERFLDYSLSKVELDALINSMKSRDLVYTNDRGVHLSNKGKEFALESGLTKIAKLLINNK